MTFLNWLVDFSLKAAVILSAAWMVTLLLRKASADLRHRVWLVAILGVAAVAYPWTMPAQVRIVVPAGLGVSAAVPARAVAFRPLPAIWVAGMLLALGRLAAGLITIAVWTRKAKKSQNVLISDRIATPLTWGFLRPVILLPAYAQEWPEAQQDLAIRHERAHAARHDWLWQMLASVVTSVFWFHPLVWLAGAEMRREAERATDDLVLASGADASDYAARLVEVARHITSTAPLAAVPMARRAMLESRVREILDPGRKRGRTSLVTRGAIALLGCALILPLAAMQETDRTAHKMDEPGMKGPRLIQKVEPQYTEEAKAAQIEGTVTLSLEIDEAGLPDNIKVVHSLGGGLDETAVEALRQWQFSPAEKDGVPVRVAATVEVNFKLL